MVVSFGFGAVSILGEGAISLRHLVQVVGDHADVAHRGHEVDVSGPARHHVHVQMLGKARASRIPLIHPDVHTVGLEGPLNQIDADTDQPPEGGLLGRGVVEQP